MRQLPQQYLDNMTLEELISYHSDNFFSYAVLKQLEKIEERAFNQACIDIEDDMDRIWMDAEMYGWDRGFKAGRESHES